MPDEEGTNVTSHEWGRVADDGTVFVRTADGERSVGQYPEGTPEEALKFYTDRFDALAFEVGLLEQRVRAGVLVSDRRWNVVLNNGIEIMLPKDDPGSALIQAVALDDGHGILSREIAAVDLRLPNRLVFRLTEAGYEAREALLKKRKGKG